MGWRLEAIGGIRRLDDDRNRRLARGLHWAPDGSCLLCSIEGGGLAIFNTADFVCLSSYQEDSSSHEDGGNAGCVSGSRRRLKAAAALGLREAESVRDCCWFPRMSSAEPVTAVFAACCRDSPVHLWDAYSAQLRASYCAFTDKDELVAPHSLSFDPTGARLYCGFDSCLRVFDLHRPGREWQDIPERRAVKRTSKPRRVPARGVYSCMAWSAQDAANAVLAVGTFRGTVGIFVPRGGDHSVGMGLALPELVLENNRSGVADVCVSRDGLTVVAAGRRDPHVNVWDLRNPSGPVWRMKREASTYQRIGIELSADDHWLWSGGRDGKVRVYSMESGMMSSSWSCGEECVSDLGLLPLRGSHMVTAHGERRLLRKNGTVGEPDDVLNVWALYSDERDDRHDV